MTQYDIFWKNLLVGTASVETVGLYTKFQCRCYFHNKGIYRIIAQYSSGKVDLGICIPEENDYVAYAKIPTKNLSNDIPQFYAKEGTMANTLFIPVQSHDAFGYINRLPEAKFYIQAGESGLLIDNV